MKIYRKDNMAFKNTLQNKYMHDWAKLFKRNLFLKCTNASLFKTELKILYMQKQDE